MDNDFAKICGFQVEPMRQPTFNPENVKERLDETVRKHDKPGELVIVAGGPHKGGEGLVDEGVLGYAIVDLWKIKIEAPRFLSRVILDSWQNERIDVLFERS